LSNHEGKALPPLLQADGTMTPPTQDVLRGTLDLLILRTLADEPMHGWGISERIEDRSKEVLQVTQGSLYPALHRLEKRGFLTSFWGSSRNNRRAKYYRLTRAGHRSLGQEEEGWERFVEAVRGVLGEPPGSEAEDPA
jgi:PadR family transcriptional regulator PadR